jgi:hypothetical protein
MTGDVFRRKDWCPTTAAFCPDPGTGHCLRVRWGGGTRERGPPWVPRLLSAVGTDHWCAAVAEDRHEVWICAASSASWDADGVPKPMQDTMSRVVPCRRGARQLRRRSSTARRTDSSPACRATQASYRAAAAPVFASSSGRKHFPAHLHREGGGPWRASDRAHWRWEGRVPLVGGVKTRYKSRSNRETFAVV